MRRYTRHSTNAVAAAMQATTVGPTAGDAPPNIRDTPLVIEMLWPMPIGSMLAGGMPSVEMPNRWAMPDSA